MEGAVALGPWDDGTADRIHIVEWYLEDPVHMTEARDGYLGNIAKWVSRKIFQSKPWEAII
jgi:hypothetical protein